MYYRDLFKMCGYEDDEIELNRPRIEKALTRWQIEPVDVKQAEEIVERYFEVELKGVRGLLKYYLQEFVDLP